MKKITKTIITIILILGIMFFEYRFIMLNIKPYIGNGGAVYLEIFDHVDEYHAESLED